MNFKANGWKVAVAVLGVFVWIIMSNYTNNLIKLGCDKSTYPDMCKMDSYNHLLLVKAPSDECYCRDFSYMLYNNIKNLFVPFAIIYIIWSLFERKRK